jgi:myo-inositol-1-phosphate synthase
VELKLEVWDSPNSAGVVIDAVRCVKLALDRGLSGSLEGPSAYFMKSPAIQHRDEDARHMVQAFIAESVSPPAAGSELEGEAANGTAPHRVAALVAD